MTDTPALQRKEPIFTAPTLIVWLLGVMWAFFAVSILAPQGILRLLSPFVDLTPMMFLAGPANNGGVFFMMSPLVGHMFLHADLMHILFNSLWLLALGAPVMRRLTSGGLAGPQMASAISGRIAPLRTVMGVSSTSGARADDPSTRRSFWAGVWFLAFFFACGVAGALTYIAFNAQSPIQLVGASGGVSGLLGAMVRFAFNRSNLFSTAEQSLAPITDKTVWVWSAAIVFINIGVGVFGLGMGGGGASIAWEAHLGGYFFGLFTFPFFDVMTRRRS